MLVRNHIVSNVATAALLYDGVKLLDNRCITRLPQIQTLVPVSVTTYSYILQSVLHLSASPFYLAPAVFLFLLGSYLPDIDQRHWFPLEHRTWTHTFYFLIPLLVLSVFCPVFFWLFLGYFLHLFWDSLSVCGLCWFRPVSGYRHYGDAKIKRRHIVKLYRVGAASEYALVILLVVIATWLTCWLQFR